MMHIHKWTNWQDVKLGDQYIPTHVPGLVFYRQIITQQRRCAKCNMVETRTT